MHANRSVYGLGEPLVVRWPLPCNVVLLQGRRSNLCRGTVLLHIFYVFLRMFQVPRVTPCWCKGSFWITPSPNQGFGPKPWFRPRRPGLLGAGGWGTRTTKPEMANLPWGWATCALEQPALRRGGGHFARRAGHLGRGPGHLVSDNDFLRTFI